MKRKIIGNLLFGLTMPVLLAFRWFPNLYDAIFNGIYIYYDFHITTLWEFLTTLYERYVLVYLLALLFILTPFQIIKDRYYTKNKKPMALWKKILIVILILMIAVVILFRSSLQGYYTLLFASVAGLGSIIALLLYYIIDRHVEVTQELNKPIKPIIDHE